jgi:quercetin dioxygenase-like cupin family protein
LVDSTELGERDPLPGWRGRFFHSEQMTFAYYEIAADAVPLHEHDHPQEEVWHVLDGTLVLSIDGIEHVAEAGCAAIVPPNTPHSATVRGAVRAIVVDTPRRDELPGGVRA